MARGDWPGITGLNEVVLGVAARAYAAAGIPVFPLFGTVEVGGEHRCECPAAENCDRPGKHPRVRWTHEATVDTQQVEECHVKISYAVFCMKKKKSTVQ